MSSTHIFKCRYRLRSLRQVPDKHLLWYCYPVDDTACRVGSNPTEALSLVPRRTQSYALHTNTQTHTHRHIHTDTYTYIHTRAGGHPGSGATRKRLRDDAYLKESSDRETTVHDYNTRERHTVATRLACKRWILGTTPWPGEIGASAGIIPIVCLPPSLLYLEYPRLLRVF